MSHSSRSITSNVVLNGLALLMVALLASGCRTETTYPNRPISLICPWSPGGGTDTVSRYMAELLRQELGVPVNVINATGGGGVTGHTRGALARPDGYTLTMITVELNMLHWRGLTSISHRDYRPSALLNKDAAALFVRSDAPWTNLTELAQHLKSNPGKMTASGTAHGGIWHLALAGWLTAIGMQPSDVAWISINGAGPSLQQLPAKGVDMVVCSLPEAKTFMDSGHARCLGVMADARVEQFPDVPTFKEQGIDWSLGGWRGLAVPADTPDSVVAVLNKAIDRAIHSAEFKQFMNSAGFNWSYEGPADFRRTLEELDAQFGAILTSPAFAGIAKGPIGPMVFPGLLGGIAVVLLAALVRRQSIRAPRPEPIFRLGWRHLIEVTLWIAMYVLLAETAGFILTAGVLLALWMWRLGVHWVPNLSVSVVLVPLIYQIFAVHLRVPLPRGWLGW